MSDLLGSTGMKLNPPLRIVDHRSIYQMSQALFLERVNSDLTSFNSCFLDIDFEQKYKVKK